MLKSNRVRQIYVWHKWTGLISGLFIFFVSLTGAVAVFKHEIDCWLTPGLAVEAQNQRAPVESLLATMQRDYPKSRVNSISLAQAPTDTHLISIRDNGKRREIFLNPYTAQVSGSRTGENFANILRQAHLRFYFYGWQGRVFVGIIGLALFISSVTGFLIYAPFMKHLAFGKIRWRQKLQLVMSDWHKLVGITTVLFNVIIALTGAVLGLENLQRFSPAAKAILHPAPSADAKKQRPENIAGRLLIDDAVTKAQTAMPGFAASSVQLPRAKRNHWMLRGQTTFTPDNSSWIMLDTHSGNVIAKHDAREALVLTKTYNLSEPLHFGHFAGMPIKILYCIVGLISSSLYITGFWVWFLKNRKSFRLPFKRKNAAV